MPLVGRIRPCKSDHDAGHRRVVVFVDAGDHVPDIVQHQQIALLVANPLGQLLVKRRRLDVAAPVAEDQRVVLAHACIEIEVLELGEVLAKLLGEPDQHAVTVVFHVLAQAAPMI